MTKEKQIQVGKQTFAIIEKEPFMVTPYSIFLAENFPRLGKLTSNSTVLDFGCGCGIQTIVAASNGAKHVYGIDIHQESVELTKKNVTKNHLYNCTILNSMEKGWDKKIDQKIDLIISNPASLPSPDELSATFWAGTHGDQMICELITLAKRTLSTTGTLLFINTSLVSLSTTFNRLLNSGFNAGIVACQKLPFRDFYKPLVPHWQTLSQNGESFFLDDNGTQYEFLYILQAMHTEKTDNSTPKDTI